MKVKLRGKDYKLRFKKVTPDCWGWIDLKNKEIDIDPALKDNPSLSKKKLEVLLHEMLHGAFPRAHEKTIETHAHEIAKALWKLGVRFK